jgi:hypothetical protein
MSRLEEYLERARLACLSNEYATAYALYEELLCDYPDNPKVLREYGQALYSEFGDLEKAAHLLE